MITEAMRVKPTAWIVPLRATMDLELGGHHIPAGADIIYSPYAMQLDPRNFTQRDRFDPDRWRPDRAAGTVSRYTVARPVHDAGMLPRLLLEDCDGRFQC